MGHDMTPVSRVQRQSGHDSSREDMTAVSVTHRPGDLKGADRRQRFIDQQLEQGWKCLGFFSPLHIFVLGRLGLGYENHTQSQD